MNETINRRLRALEARLKDISPGLPPHDWSAFSDEDLAKIETLLRRLVEGPPLSSLEEKRLEELATKIIFQSADGAL